MRREKREKTGERRQEREDRREKTGERRQGREGRRQKFYVFCLLSPVFSLFN
jgi:hypothetical protein